MYLILSQILLCLLCFFVAHGQASQRIVVAADGSGDFRTVQQAVDQIPDDNKQRVVIQIKPGVYKEQIRVSAGKRYVTSGAHIKPEGWDNWRDPAREKTAWFGEYKSEGPGANVQARVSWSRQLTPDEAKSFSRERFFSYVPQGQKKEEIGTIAWKDAHDKAEEWYASAEALRIADNVVLYQRSSGGWPKDIDMGKPLNDSARAALLRQKKDNDSTIDNGATFTQLSFLARVYTAQQQERHRESFLNGFDFLLKAQYPNGGWPQFYPDLQGYHKHITFNDGAMIGVMKLLRDVVARRTLLLGPAGGFYSASGEDVYPGCWSALFAAEVAAKAVKARHPQDVLGAYRGSWGSTLGDYLRGPQQNLRFLLPLVYKNPVMTQRLAEAILLGQSLVK